MVAPGIHYGLSSREYHAWKLDKSKLIEGPISCSMLKDFSDSPFAWRWGPEKEVTAAMRAGSLMDYALTEPGALESQCVICPYESFRSNAAKEWKLENSERLIVTEAQLGHARKAAERVREHKEAGPILDDAAFQVAVVGEIAGIPSKCLLDIVPPEDSWDETLWDYKTTSGLDDESLRRTIGQFRYHWQGAFYRSQWNKLSPDRHCERFGFIWQDRDTLEVRVTVLTDDDMAQGNRALGVALKDYATAAHRGIRSRYASGITELGQLPFQAMNEDERLSTHER